jgi:acetylornithine deacetylase/succinyl-diaminopimelate desuccinylase-like protein
VERPECSTPGHAPDLVGRLRGSGAKRVLLLGHLDTVVAHGAHRPMARDGDRLTGSGTVDMKGGVALSLALMRELADRPELYAEAAVLLVNDEEWRTTPFAHAERFAGFDACLCFEAGERGRPRTLIPLGIGAGARPERAARAGGGGPDRRPLQRPGGPRPADRRAHDPSLG